MKWTYNMQTRSAGSNCTLNIHCDVTETTAQWLANSEIGRKAAIHFRKHGAFFNKYKGKTSDVELSEILAGKVMLKPIKDMTKEELEAHMEEVNKEYNDLYGSDKKKNQPHQLTEHELEQLNKSKKS